jgi:hypothetical protein
MVQNGWLEAPDPLSEQFGLPLSTDKTVGLAKAVGRESSRSAPVVIVKATALVNRRIQNPPSTVSAERSAYTNRKAISG